MKIQCAFAFLCLRQLKVGFIGHGYKEYKRKRTKNVYTKFACLGFGLSTDTTCTISQSIEGWLYLVPP